MTENQNIIQSDETPAAALEVDDIVLGGGNVKLLKELPKGCRQGDNANAFLGGTRFFAINAHHLHGRMGESSSVPAPASHSG